MIKVHYDIQTTLVKGYYPDSINYASIPEPFVEIENDAQVLDKQMCVVNGVYQEYIEPVDVQLQRAKTSKISEIKSKRDTFLSSNITTSTGTYKATQTAKTMFWSKINGATTADYPISWRLADDITWVQLTKDQANALYIAFEAQETSGYTQETNFINQVNAATSAEEVEAIVIEYTNNP